MAKIVTSVSLFKVAAGQQMSITYSEINESGETVKDNIKVSRIILEDNENVINDIKNVLADAKDIVDSIE